MKLLSIGDPIYFDWVVRGFAERPNPMHKVASEREYSRRLPGINTLND